jgi:hypothetical protein
LHWCGAVRPSCPAGKNYLFTQLVMKVILFHEFAV